jgi:hypothetical protein
MEYIENEQMCCFPIMRVSDIRKLLQSNCLGSNLFMPKLKMCVGR